MVEMVAALVPVESAMRITGSSDSVTVFSAAFLTTDLDSVGHSRFCEVDRSRVSWAETSWAGAVKAITKSRNAEVNLGTVFMLKGDDEPGERAGNPILLHKQTLVIEKVNARRALLC